MAEGPIWISGQVVRGVSRGRKLGFPTANIDSASISEQRHLEGVWAGWIRWAGEPWRLAVVNVGRRPTFDDEALSVEAHIMDFAGDLYGRVVELSLIHRIRDERQFDSVDALIEQIAVDARQARTLLKCGPEEHNPTEVEQ